MRPVLRTVKNHLFTPLSATLLPFLGALTAAPTLTLPLGPCPQGQEAGEAPREVMWKAPSRADWAKPCLVQWQRNFDDALAVAEQTGKPVLICVNMDGEIASEHYAGIRYRTPDTATLYEPYVTVIASTYRHTPRDYTDDGQRIPCPRFGGVTCGEHISIEPILFEQYFEGQRVAPRHIMVELDKSEVFDVYYAFDTKSVFETLKKGVEGRQIKPVNTDRGTFDWEERILSRDSLDRVFVEKAFVEADEAKRLAMLEAAVKAGDRQSTELMRLALLQEESSTVMVGSTTAKQLAWKSMVEDPTVGNVPLMETALNLPLDDQDLESLISALENLSDQAPRAKLLATVQRGLFESGQALNVGERVKQAQSTNLKSVLAENQAVKDALESRATEWRESGTGDGSIQLRVAESFLARALDANRRAKETKYLFEDARTQAQQALEMGQSGWLAHGILAICEFRYGTLAKSDEHANTAVNTMPVHAMGRVAVETLRLFARSKRRAIRDAQRMDSSWSPEMLGQAQAAYTVLEHHPLCKEQDCVTQLDFLIRVGAYPQSGKVLESGLKRFPDSAELHLRLRNRILGTRGATGLNGLEATYEAMLASPEATPNLTWFAGYASLLAAEYHRRAGEYDSAVGAYDRSIGHYEANLLAMPHNSPTANHFIAISLAAKARMATERGDLAIGHSLILQAIEKAPNSMSTIDGLGFTGVMTATTLIARLGENEQQDLANELQGVLDSLDAETRRPPAFDRVGPRRR